MKSPLLKVVIALVLAATAGRICLDHDCDGHRHDIDSPPRRW
jgi:hypothetical protein